VAKDDDLLTLTLKLRGMIEMDDPIINHLFEEAVRLGEAYGRPKPKGKTRRGKRAGRGTEKDAMDKMTDLLLEALPPAFENCDGTSYGLLRLARTLPMMTRLSRMLVALTGKALDQIDSLDVTTALNRHINRPRNGMQLVRTPHDTGPVYSIEPVVTVK
jgi:hypothetical protein